jgi:hypothetical protein
MSRSLRVRVDEASSHFQSMVLTLSNTVNVVYYSTVVFPKVVNSEHKFQKNLKPKFCNPAGLLPNLLPPNERNKEQPSLSPPPTPLSRYKLPSIRDSSFLRVLDRRHKLCCHDEPLSPAIEGWYCTDSPFTMSGRNWDACWWSERSSWRVLTGQVDRGRTLPSTTTEDREAKHPAASCRKGFLYP